MKRIFHVSIVFLFVSFHSKILGSAQKLLECFPLDGKGNTLTWHSVGKMSGLYGTFADSLCQVILYDPLASDQLFVGGFGIGDMLYEAKNEGKFGVGIMEQHNPPYPFDYQED